MKTNTEVLEMQSQDYWMSLSPRGPQVKKVKIIYLLCSPTPLPHHHHILFSFFILIISQVYSKVFQWLHDTQYCNRLKLKVDKRIQLSSIKSDIKRNLKSETMSFLSINFCSKKYCYFHLNRSFYKMMLLVKM